MGNVERIQAGDELSESKDIIESNLEFMRAVFPETFSEDGIDFEVLRQLLGDEVAESDDKFGLKWHGKKLSRRIALIPSMGTLRPSPEDSVDWETTQNLMIEGDNLEVLKLLQKSYSGKVKLIYIDPPYNTGKDFVYKDDYRDNTKNYLELTGQTDEDGRKLSTNVESSGRFHTDWLNMMYPRIKLARNLLKDDGFLVVSIDDGEVATLRLVLDELIGEENFVANIVWQKKYTRANDATFFSANHDHLLVYVREIERAELGRVPRSDDQLAAYANPDDHPKGRWKATPLHARSGVSTDEYVFANGTAWRPPTGTFRRFSDETMRQLESDDAIWFGKDGSATPSRKSFLSEMDPGVVPVTIWEHEFAGHNHQANTELKDLGMTGMFTSPKPTLLIRRLLQLMTSPTSSDIIMDFFAGSGTTGHAVLLENSSDGGNRRYVLVQLPEPADSVAAQEAGFIDIAQLTKERLRRAGAKVSKEHSEWDGDVGFRVFKLDTSNIRAWSPDRDEVEASLLDYQEHLSEDRSEDDILYEMLLKLGLDLCVPIEERDIGGVAVSSVGGGVLMTCLAESIPVDAIEALGTGITGWLNELEPAGDTTVIFRDSAFENDVAKTNIAAILNQAGVASVRSI